MKPVPQREEAIFQAAVQLAGAERATFLNGACLGDPALRQRLEALLAAHDEPDDLSPKDKPAAVATMKLELSDAPDEAIGQTLGAYKLREKIGEGGCGVVYVADQEHPVRRRVALKVIKLGMDTKQVVARFESERQALAMMDHPNIAKVLDAGATELGRPYFVMELVRGIRITEYCDQNNLSTNERLDLFIKVCQAIQHAHQKGIIHRDIKPSNILVTLHDGVPVPKVIDFGIAKATEGRLTDNTIYTQLHQFIGTPAYMSPEQAEMSGLDIDTRSDIYSLGVLLYELLAGSTPFDANELMASGIDQMRKTIREKEPVRPSTRFATLKGEELTTTAKRRSADKAKLVHQLKGDLDWIVMKCLEKDRTRRYDTANGLAFDIKRHLNNEPVLARPPSTAYRFQKAFRRNKLMFAAGSVVAIALVSGLCLAALGWRQTSLERDKALQAKAQAVEAQASESVQRQKAEANEKKAVEAQANEARLREQAEAQTLAARRSAYNADMNQVQQMLSVNNLGEAQRLLKREKPALGETDLRGWEWRYLWQQTRADDHEVIHAGTNTVIQFLSFSWDGRLLSRKQNGERMTVTDLISRRTVFQPPDAFRPDFAHHDARLAYVFHHGSSNDLIRIVDTSTLQPDLSAQKESRFETSWKATRWLEFTPDDRRLITVSLRTDSDATNEARNDLTAWDPDTGHQLWQRAIDFNENAGNRRPVAISPDGMAVAVLLSDGRVQVLETKDGSERFTTKTRWENGYVVMFSPDSSTLLTATGVSSIQLRDARTGQAGDTLEGHSGFVNDLLFTPDGKRLISSSADQTIRVWDWSTRKTVSVLRTSPGVDGLALAPDGRILASRCPDGSIFLWDLTKPARHLGYQTLPRNLWPAVFTPDSQSILGDDESNGVALWDARTLKETRRLWGDTTNYSIISPDAKWVLRADGYGHLHVWDVSSGLQTTNFIPLSGDLAQWPSFTGNGNFLVFHYREGTNTVLETWDTATWQRKDSLTLDFKPYDNRANGFTTSLTNSYAIMGDDGFLHFFDVGWLHEAPKLITAPHDFYHFATSPDGRLLVGTY